MSTGDPSTGEVGSEDSAVGEWQTLDVRTVVVTAVLATGVAVGAAVPTGIGLISNSPPVFVLLLLIAGAVVLVAAVTAGDYVRLRKTRYRIGEQRAELRTGILVTKRRSLARERIRTVDLTADPLHRILGLVQVKIGTGEQREGGQSSLLLRAVRKSEGDRLRRILLERPRTGAAQPSQPPATGTLAVLDPSWIRFAPVSFLTPALGAAAFGALLQVAEWFGLQDGIISWVVDHVGVLPLVVAVLVLVVTGVAAGTVGAVAVFVEGWWNYRLEREPGGTLRVQRGLLTTRSISLEDERLRGVELVEPLGNRLLGAARLDAVVTGLETKNDEKTQRKTLLPSAPRAVTDGVAAAVLREPVSPTAAARLRPHPRAARGRRLRGAVVSALLPVAVLAILGVLLTEVLLHIAWITAVVAVPVAVLLALDAYRNLGHGLSGDYLLARSGAVRRGTVALQRKGIIGWTIRQSIFQRRGGLITVTATTAAGSGAYSILDAGTDDGLALAEEAVPELLRPFLRSP
jgi:putative membrane protein